MAKPSYILLTLRKQLELYLIKRPYFKATLDCIGALYNGITFNSSD